MIYSSGISEEILLIYFDIMIALNGLRWLSENIIRDEFRHMWN